MHGYPSRLVFCIIVLIAACAARGEDKPAATDTASDFVRFRENAKGAQLQTAIVTYRNADGVVVELIGAIHIADKAYYEKLNKRFTRCEALLYEMVGEGLEVVEEENEPVVKPALPKKPEPGATAGPSAPGAPTLEERVRDIEAYIVNGRSKPFVAPKAPPPGEEAAEEAAYGRLRWLHPLYDTLKNTLQLESQMEGIDYSKKNFVHADMTARQFSAMQQERGEGFLQMWWRAMQAQIAQPEAAAPSSPGVLKILEILCRPDSPTELKRLMGRMFDQVETIMSGMETEKGSVIVVERNKVALEMLTKEIAKGRKRLGIFYGAAHMTDMEQRLLAMGFVRAKSEWLTAWDLPPEPPPVQPKPAPAVKVER